MSLRVRIVPTQSGSNGVMGIMVRQGSIGNVKTYGIVIPHSKTQPEKFGTVNRYDPSSPIIYPNVTNFVYANGHTSPSWLLLRRKSNVVSAEFSNDGITWIPFDSFSNFDTNSILFWGVFSGKSNLRVSMDSIGLENSDCGSNFLCTPTPDGVCSSIPERTFLECSSNTWRYLILGTSISSFSVIIDQKLITLAPILDAPFDNYNGSDQFVLLHKAISGDGIMTAKFSSLQANSYAGLAIYGKMGVTIDVSDTVNCLVPQVGNLTQKARINGVLTTLDIVNPLNVSLSPTISSSYWLQLIKSGSLYQCRYSMDGTVWKNASDPVLVSGISSANFIAGIINNNGVVVSNVEFRGFGRLCNNNGYCGTDSSEVLDQCFCTKSVGTTCQQKIYEFHIKDGSMAIQTWENAITWSVKSANGSLVDADRAPVWGDTVFLDAVGTYAVYLGSNQFLKDVTIGGLDAFVTLNVGTGVSFVTNGTMTIRSGSKFTLNGNQVASSLIVDGTLENFGKVDANLIVNVNGTLFMSGSFSFPSRIYGNITSYGTIDATGYSEFHGQTHLDRSRFILRQGGTDIKFYGLTTHFLGMNATALVSGTKITLLGPTIWDGDVYGSHSNVEVVCLHASITFRGSLIKTSSLTNILPIHIMLGTRLSITNTYFGAAVTGGGILETSNTNILTVDPYPFTIELESMTTIGTIRISSGNVLWKVKSTTANIIQISSPFTWQTGIIKKADTINVLNTQLTILGNCGLENSHVRMQGSKFLFDTSFDFTLVNANITSFGGSPQSPVRASQIHHLGSGRILTVGSSFIFNHGLYIADSSKNVIRVGHVQNQGTFRLEGEKMIFVHGIIENGQQGNPNVIFTPQVNVTMSPQNWISGNITLSGKVTCPNLTLNISYGIVRIDESFHFSGHLNMTRFTMLILNLVGKGPEGIEHLYVNGTFFMDALIYIRLDTVYTPQFGDRIPFFTYVPSSLATENSIFTFDAVRERMNGNTSMIGIPMTGAIMDMTGDLVIEPSLSFFQNGYQCRYMGHARTLESRSYYAGEFAITATFPDTDGWVSLGIDLLTENFNGTTNISRSLIIVSSRNETFQVMDHTIVQNTTTRIIDMSSSISRSFFKIGDKLYRSISMFISSGVIFNQQVIFLAGNHDKPWTRTGPFPGHTWTETLPLRIFQSGGNEEETNTCTNYLQPQRAEVVHPAPVAFMFFIYFITGALCIAFYFKQPLSSRGVSPLLTLFFLFAQLAMELRTYGHPTSFQGAYCVYLAFGFFPIQQIVYSMIFLYFIRYFSIINLNQNKNSLVKNILKGEAISRWIKVKLFVLKVFSSIWVTFLFLILSLVLFLILFNIPLLTRDYICTKGALVEQRAIHSILLIVVYGVIALTGLIDLISNIGILIYCKWYKYLFKSDPYFFRAQIWLFIPFMIYSLAAEMAIAFLSETYDQILKNYQIIMALNTVACTLLLIIEIWFPLVITIIKWIRSLLQKKKDGGVLRDIIKNEEARDLFFEFCKMEFSVENILCWTEILEFKKSKTNVQYADEVYKKYFAGAASVMEVNVTSSDCARVKQQIDSGKVDADLFNKLENTVMTNLGDTYCRFSFHQPYLDLLAQQETNRQLIEGK